MAPHKLVFGAQNLEFCGFCIGPDGISPSLVKLAAIANFPVPKDRTDLWPLVGLANQLGGFTRNVAEVLIPLRQLLSTKHAFLWYSDKQADFERALRLLSTAPIHHSFNPKLPVRLYTNAATTRDLGYVLVQPHKGIDRHVASGSRMLNDAEAHYTPSSLSYSPWSTR